MGLLCMQKLRGKFSRLDPAAYRRQDKLCSGETLSHTASQLQLNFISQNYLIPKYFLYLVSAKSSRLVARHPVSPKPERSPINTLSRREFYCKCCLGRALPSFEPPVPLELVVDSPPELKFQPSPVTVPPSSFRILPVD